MEQSGTRQHFRRKKPFFFLFFILGFFLMGALVMALWNFTLPSLLHISYINYWQSMALLLLCRLLFGGFKFGPRGDRRASFRGNPFREKWMNMSEEEKNTFKDKWKQRCGR